MLNRAVWSPRQAAGILLVLLLQHLDQGDGPLIFGIDETLERRRGPKIKSLGIYRDAVRSSRSQVVKASGLRWISLMWLGQVPWAGRYWALPFLTVLAPSARYHRQRGRRHKKLTDWARQMILQLRRWLPQRPLVLVGDGGYAVLDLLHCCQSLAQPVTLIARLRLDAALYEPAPPRQPGRNGRPPLKGRRLPALKSLVDHPGLSWTTAAVAWYNGATRTVELTSQTAVWYRSGKPPVPLRWVLVRDPQGEFATQALLCTDLAVEPAQILEWFVLRWQLEVTFQEVRAHLGVETQRQWSDHAIARTTPILMGLFSWTTLAAHLMQEQRPMSHRTAAWYAKPSPTFVDACHRSGAPPLVAGVGGFFTVRRRTGYMESPGCPVPPTCRFTRLRGLKCAKPSQRGLERQERVQRVAGDAGQRKYDYAHCPQRDNSLQEPNHYVTLHMSLRRCALPSCTGTAIIDPRTSVSRRPLVRICRAAMHPQPDEPTRFRMRSSSNDVSAYFAL